MVTAECLAVSSVVLVKATAAAVVVPCYFPVVTAIGAVAAAFPRPVAVVEPCYLFGVTAIAVAAFARHVKSYLQWQYP